VATLLTLLTGVLVTVCVAITPWIIELIAPGFTGEKRLETVHLVQILFPGVGLLVLGAWCLGILNSHRQFLLPYSVPVLSSVAVIAALVTAGDTLGPYSLAERAAWGVVIGAGLQLLVQLPSTLRLARGVRPELGLRLEATRTVIRNFLPVVVARGVVQISAYVDSLLASLLPTGAVSALAYAQLLYTLPVSLFGMSVSAAQLPAMASATGGDAEVAAALRMQLDRGLRQVAFFIVPSVAGFVVLGDVVVATLFQTGVFGEDSTRYVWAVLAGSTVGLLAATQGRLYSSAFYALHDTRTPLKYASIRVALTVGLGWIMALYLPGWLGLEARWGTVGLTASAGMAGWVEFLSLRAALNRRIGATGLPPGLVPRLWAAALPASAVGFGVKLLAGAALHPVLRGGVVLGAFGLVYAALTLVFGIPEARGTLDKVLRRLRRG
jgi:putative peptidoglycan lipid II flippase